MERQHTYGEADDGTTAQLRQSRQWNDSTPYGEQTMERQHAYSSSSEQLRRTSGLRTTWFKPLRRHGSARRGISLNNQKLFIITRKQLNT